MLIDSHTISPQSFLCFVDDGSKDASMQMLIHALQEHARPIVQVLRLSRNFGHQNALLAGLFHVRNQCDYAISLDCDLQDDICAIATFLQKAREGADIVYGVRKSRDSDSVFKKYSALGFYTIMRMLGVNLIYNHADFRLLSRRAICALLAFDEAQLFLRGIIPLVGFPCAYVSYDRQPRVAGETKYPLRKMLSFAWNGITSFSITPLRAISLLGGVFFCVSLIIGAWILYIKLVAHEAIVGWASVMLLLSFVSGIQLLSLGVIGEYIGKIYTEAKHRPKFFIQDIYANSALPSHISMHNQASHLATHHIYTNTSHISTHAKPTQRTPHNE